MSAPLYCATYTASLLASTSTLITLDVAPRGVWLSANIAGGIMRARWRTHHMNVNAMAMPALYGLVISDQALWLPEEIKELEILNSHATTAYDYFVTVVA